MVSAVAVMVNSLENCSIKGKIYNVSRTILIGEIIANIILIAGIIHLAYM